MAKKHFRRSPIQAPDEPPILPYNCPDDEGDKLQMNHLTGKRRRRKRHKHTGNPQQLKFDLFADRSFKPKEEEPPQEEEKPPKEPERFEIYGILARRHFEEVLRKSKAEFEKTQTSD